MPVLKLFVFINFGSILMRLHKVIFPMLGYANKGESKVRNLCFPILSFVFRESMVPVFVEDAGYGGVGKQLECSNSHPTLSEEGHNCCRIKECHERDSPFPCMRTNEPHTEPENGF